MYATDKHIYFPLNFRSASFILRTIIEMNSVRLRFLLLFFTRQTERSHAEFEIIRGSLTLKIKYELVLSHVTSHTYVSMYRRGLKNRDYPPWTKLLYEKLDILFTTYTWHLTRYSNALLFNTLYFYQYKGLNKIDVYLYEIEKLFDKIYSSQHTFQECDKYSVN